MTDIQILEVQQLALPAECARCGTGRSHYRYIDFGLQIIPYGRVVLCTECARELAEAIGYVAGDKYSRLESEYADYIHTVAELQTNHAQRVAELTKEIENRDAILESRYSTFNSVSDPVLSGDGDVRNVDEPETPKGEGSASPKSNRRSSKPNSSRGSKVVPSLEELLGTE